MPSLDFVTLRQYENSLQARLDAGLLEAENIPSVIEGDELTTTMSHLANTLGGVKLRVKAEDVQRASEILQSNPQWQRPVLVSDKSLDARVRRAFRSALIGILLPFVTPYSLWLVGDLLGEFSTLTSRQKRQLLIAGGINLFMLTLIWILFVPVLQRN